MEATITSKGQVTLPKALREALNLSTGDKLSFELGEQGEVRMTPKHSPLQLLKGLLPAPESPVSLDEMERAIQQRGSVL